VQQQPLQDSSARDNPFCATQPRAVLGIDHMKAATATHDCCFSRLGGSHEKLFFYFYQMQAKIPDSGSIQIIQTNESGIVATLFFLKS